MNQEYMSNLILMILLAISILGKNNALAISISVLLLISLISGMGGPFYHISQGILIFLDKYGLTLGVIILMMGILAPFALGNIDMKGMLQHFKTYKGILSFAAGILVAIFGSKGGYLLAMEPELVTSVVIGTVVGIVVFKGYPVGPLIGSGIAYFLIVIVESLMKK
ncbi:MAG: DUF441 domain-containing protein [Bacillota bacterium]